MSDEPLFTCTRAGFEFKVFRNRIDVSERKLLSTKRETILLRNVASVEVKRIGGKIVLKLNDQTEKEYIIGLQAEDARQAIISAL